MSHQIQIIRDITDADLISSIDLRAEALRAESFDATALLVDGQAAELVEIDGRVGFVWGGDAVWGDAIDGEGVSATVERLLSGEVAS